MLFRSPSIRTANLYIGKGNDLKVERSKVIIYQDYAKTCTITYYNQNNSGIFSVLKQVPVTIGSSVKLESIPVSYPTGKPIFNGWNTMQSGEGTKYYDNQIITATTDLSLYAMWDKAPGKHSGWAGSNIYWDPVKEILTFDDNGDDRSHENYQGVFFKWGSLVATSPTDSWNNTDGEFFLNNPSLSTSDKNLSKVIYVPNTNSSTNGGWNPNIKSNNRWANIPYVKDGFYNTFPMTEEAHKRAYLLEVHNPTKNIGDICKYITDQGWAPRADEGIKWRMPTSNDFEKYGMTDNLIFREYGQFNEVSTTNNFGQTIINNGRMTNYNNEAIKLPACGTRERSGSLGYEAEIVGGYWGSTIGINPQSYNGLNSLGLYFSNFYDYPSELFPQYPDIREIGFAIRCVQE